MNLKHGYTVIFIGMILSIILCLNGCVDFNYDKRLYAYGSGKWVSQSYNSWFIVDDDDINANEPKGEITVNGETINFVMVFDYGNSVAFCKSQSDDKNYDYSFQDRFMEGKCSFYPDRIVIKITYTDESIIKQKIDELTYIKT